MPFTISRIGPSRGQPIVQGFGKSGAIIRRSASITSVWYRLTRWVCCCRVVDVHMANPGWFEKPLAITAGADDSALFKISW
jgi:hypothetical protein